MKPKTIGSDEQIAYIKDAIDAGHHIAAIEVRPDEFQSSITFLDRFTGHEVELPCSAKAAQWAWDNNN